MVHEDHVHRVDVGGQHLRYTLVPRVAPRAVDNLGVVRTGKALQVKRRAGREVDRHVP